MVPYISVTVQLDYIKNSTLYCDKKKKFKEQYNLREKCGKGSREHTFTCLQLWSSVVEFHPLRGHLIFKTVKRYSEPSLKKGIIKLNNNV